MKARLYKWAGASTVGALALIGPASAGAVTTPYDVAPVTDGIVAQITATLPIVLPVAGGLIALGLAMKLVRRFSKV
jgi:hypothetical protein